MLKKYYEYHKEFKEMVLEGKKAANVCFSNYFYYSNECQNPKKSN